MANPPQLHPLQPLANEMSKILCAIQDLKGSIDSQAAIEVVPPKTPVANWGRVIVGTTPTLIRPARSERIEISIVNSTGVTVYLGTDTTVTQITGANPGYELMAGSSWDDDKYTGAIYGVVAVGTAVITYWDE